MDAVRTCHTASWSAAVALRHEMLVVTCDSSLLQHLAEESNLVLQIRSLLCLRHTRRAKTKMSRPGLEPGPRPSESRMRSVTPSGQIVHVRADDCPVFLG